MSSPTDAYQQYQAPEWFSEELRRIGGENPYGDPVYIVRWGQGGQDECLYRAGGHWNIPVSYRGYRYLLLGGGTPSWMLLQWQPAVNFGTPESFYVAGLDEESNLQTIGEYPYFGKYVMLYNLCWRDMQNGQLKIEGMPLNSQILDLVVPIIEQSRDISWEKTKAALKELQEKEDAADLSMVEDAMRDASLAFKGPSSYARQGCRTWYIDKKVEAMNRNWNRMVNNARTLGRGLSSYSENPTQ